MPYLVLKTYKDSPLSLDPGSECMLFPRKRVLGHVRGVLLEPPLAESISLHVTSVAVSTTECLIAATPVPAWIFAEEQPVHQQIQLDDVICLTLRNCSAETVHLADSPRAYAYVTSDGEPQ